MTRLFSLCFFLTLSAHAAECPSTIYYANGSYLKSGSTFYYANNNYLKSGSTLYYPNGNYLKSGSTFYYANGNYLKSGSTLYYPNGNYLKSGSTLYYVNGNYLKSGSTFYYRNGNYARSGSTLYRENGTTTEFPVTLEERIADFGSLHAYVEKNSERLDLDLGRLVNSELVSVKVEDAKLEADTFPLLIEIGTGAPGEKVRLRIAGDEARCELAGNAPGNPVDFELSSKIADLSVRVHDSRDAERVKQALREALRALEQ
jgi:hypothetical protein